MAFSRFFGRGRDATPAEPPTAEAEPGDEQAPESSDDDGDALPEDASQRS